jgi:hypothetical protein
VAPLSQFIKSSICGIQPIEAPPARVDFPFQRTYTSCVKYIRIYISARPFSKKHLYCFISRFPKRSKVSVKAPGVFGQSTHSVRSKHPAFSVKAPAAFVEVLRFLLGNVTGAPVLKGWNAVSVALGHDAHSFHLNKSPSEKTFLAACRKRCGTRQGLYRLSLLGR